MEQNIEKLNDIKEEIENLDNSCHLEIFNLIKSDNIEYNSNRNGIFINLSLVSENVLKKLENYIQYKKTQKNYLNQDEIIKEQYKKDFFN